MNKLNKIGLGTVQFGLTYGIANQKGKPDLTQVESIINKSRHSEIEFLDTASAYGDAEKILGRLGVSTFKVVSKFLPSESFDDLSSQLNNTLSNLNTESLYGYLAHKPLELLKRGWEWPFIQSKKEEGKILKTGFSLNNPEELIKLLDSNLVPDIIQIPFNFIDRRFEKIIKEFKKTNKLEVHSRSVFLQGLLLMNAENVPPFLIQLKPTIEKLNTIDHLNDRLLNFVLEQDFIDVVIVGIQDTDQLSQLLNKTNHTMPTNFYVGNFPEDILLPMNWNNK